MSGSEYGARAAELPAGFVEETLATNLNCATAIAAAPDGRVFIAEQTGALRVWKDGRLLDEPFARLHVTEYWERGLIGVVLHPEFPKQPFVYTLAVTDQPFVHHVLSRFTADDDVASPGSEKILFEGDDQSRLGGNVPAGHQGGPLRFGHDGKLYISIGEQTAGEPAQRLDTLQGKILRLNPDGSIPEDNPFFRPATGKYRAIYARGVRNSFGLAVQPAADGGRMFFTDVGASAFEEVNELASGGNYGWPRAEGYSTNAPFKSPLYAYPPVIGRSIVGGAFYPKTCVAADVRRLTLPSGIDGGKGSEPPHAGCYPDKWRGRLFFADFMNHWLKALDPNAPTNVMTFARGFNGPIAVELAPDGSLLVLNRGTIWRDPKKFATNSGSLVRIRYTGQTPAQVSSRPPGKLSATGLFRSLATLEPRAGFLPFELKAPAWLPGVVARRWFALPAGAKIGFSMTNEWTLPPGTIVIQHFEPVGAAESSPLRDRFETHVVRVDEGHCHHAGAYRWDADGRDATLMEDGEIANLPGPGKLHWFSPGAEECLSLETVTSGFVLQLNTRQLNRDLRDAQTGRTENQLRAWNHRGLLDPPLREDQFDSLPRLASLEDTNASTEHRVRSYLDANCAVCHRPGGPSRGNWDARFQTPFAQQGLLNGEPVAGDLGISGAKLIVPGSADQSLLYQRVKRTDFFRMPPVTVNDTPSPLLPVLKEWIDGMHQAVGSR
jgi:glucose/arabinose dehydrogenase